ncbi:MAG: poly-beta-1,6-N-acetyl-D-glucosamine N-deacetylase PgaB [Pseudomonadales bacterium]
MKRTLLIFCLFLSGPGLLVVSAHAARVPVVESVAEGPDLLALCYHDVVHTEEAMKKDPMAITVDMLVQHLSWLAGAGYTPVSLAHWRSDQPLPEKPVLLTFDDGYKSFRTRVLPLLELYGFPAVLAPVTSWVDTPADAVVDYGGEPRPREEFLNWQDVAEIRRSGLVEVVSHSHDMHQGILANVYGNLQPMASARAYLRAEQRYETAAEFSARVKQDLARSRALLAEHAGEVPPVVAWPYGAYNIASNAAAAEVGFNRYFSLEDRPNRRSEAGVHRKLISNQTDLAGLQRMLQNRLHDAPVRAVHLDMDYIYDADETQFVRNLDLLVERIQSMQVSAVYLQAFADPDGDGVADAVYFPNRHLPVRKDMFNRVAWQLRTRAGVRVYAWMPVLAFKLPDAELNQQLTVTSVDGSHLKRYHRLSPFHPEARRIIGQLYADLGRSVAFDGVLFHDDAFLTDREDNSAAARAYAQSLGLDQLSARQKTEYLLDFTDELSAVLRDWQPGLKTARNLYAQVVLDPASEAWWAQNFSLFLERYDYTALMAMPYLEQASNPRAWLSRLRRKVSKLDPDYARTVFHLQTRDWRTQSPIPDKELAAKFAQLLGHGVRHIAYYPDDFYNNQPALRVVRKHLSVNSFPALKNQVPQP